MTAKQDPGLDAERVWQLYQLKGMDVKTLAKTLNTDVVKVRAALALRAKNVRDADKEEAARARLIKDERLLFNTAFPEYADDEGELWEGWLARSELKMPRNAS